MPPALTPPAPSRYPQPLSPAWMAGPASHVAHSCRCPSGQLWHVSATAAGKKSGTGGGLRGIPDQLLAQQGLDGNLYIFRVLGVAHRRFVTPLTIFYRAGLKDERCT